MAYLNFAAWYLVRQGYLNEDEAHDPVAVETKYRDLRQEAFHKAMSSGIFQLGRWS